MNSEQSTENKIDFMCKSNDLQFSSAIQTIITKYNIPHTKNNNGFFLNLSLLDYNIIDELYNLFIHQHNNCSDANYVDYSNKVYTDANKVDISEINKTYYASTKSTTYTSTTANKGGKRLKMNKLDNAIIKTLKDNLNLI
tara:strand:- start:1134 stop:1553 length:420 start_codon:yes stop_codon:yes gene_type:complete